MEKNQIEIGMSYRIGDVDCVAKVYNKDKEVLLVRESDGGMTFVLGDFIVKDGEICYKMAQNYSVKDVDFVNQIRTEMAGVIVANDYPMENLIKDIAGALKKKYFKIPSYLLEVVAEAYCAKMDI